MEYYKRKLPHWQPKGAEYFITFRLAGTLPKEAVLALKEKREHFNLMRKKSGFTSLQKANFEEKIFETYDHLLDCETTGPIWLSNKDVAKIVEGGASFL